MTANPAPKIEPRLPLTTHDPRRMRQALQRRASQLTSQTVGPGPRGLPVSVIDCLQRVDHRESLVMEHALHPQLRGAVRLVRDRWVVVLNAADGRRRARFTLAHEIGHILLGDWRGAPAVREALCDAFAAELLMPAAAMRSVWAREPDAATVARRFDVSRPAVVRRVRELGLR